MTNVAENPTFIQSRTDGVVYEFKFIESATGKYLYATQDGTATRILSAEDIAEGFHDVTVEETKLRARMNGWSIRDGMVEYRVGGLLRGLIMSSAAYGYGLVTGYGMHYNDGDMIQTDLTGPTVLSSAIEAIETEYPIP